jgi:hypothetical protein
MFIDNNFA